MKDRFYCDLILLEIWIRWLFVKESHSNSKKICGTVYGMYGKSIYCV